MQTERKYNVLFFHSQKTQEQINKRSQRLCTDPLVHRGYIGEVTGPGDKSQKHVLYRGRDPRVEVTEGGGETNRG